MVIWGPFLRQFSQSSKQETFNENFRDDTNIELYHQHRAEIEQDYKSGGIDEESYQYLIEELDKSLLLDIEGNKNAAAEFDERRKRFSLAWPAVISLFVFVFSFAVYMKTGAYDKLNQAPAQAASDPHGQLDDGQQQLLRIQKLKKQTETDPENSQAWYSLGQGLIGLGEFDEAINAFDQVIRIEGEHADLIGAKAQAMYYKNEQVISPEVQAMIDKALALDALDPSTNILLGMHNFMAKNYQQAIDYWQRVLDSGRQSVNVEALQGAIGEAKNRLGLTTSNATGANPHTEESLAGPQITVDVSLSDEVYQQMIQGEDKIVFIYATPTDGQRMPVAALKLKASDLPTTVVLNDARAMTPQAKLSSVDSVHIYAVVSKQGGAGIKPGDFKAERLGVPVNTTTPVQLVVDHLVE